MAPQVLFLLSALAAWPIGLEARVVQDFSTCNEFFYKNAEPTGMDQNAIKICQQRRFTYYASLYSTYHRIPVYSAYHIDDTCRNNQLQRRGLWFIEPQISDIDGLDMDVAGTNKELIKVKQALNEDYELTDYDRGHLNPNSYHCNEGRVATFTLTNAVPMDACFNRVHWKRYEDYLKTLVLELSGMGRAFFVTGVVPSRNRIPVEELDTTDNVREFNRVTIPSHVWTALCFDHNDEQYSFSIAYMGPNTADGVIQVMSVIELGHRLNAHYGSNNVQIFDNDCHSDSEESKKVHQKLYRKLDLTHIQRMFALGQNVQDILSASLSKRHRRSGSQEPSKKPRISEIKLEMNYGDMSEWFESNEYMKENTLTTCMFEAHSKVHSIWPSYGRDELRRIRSADDDYICKLTTEKSRPESVISADGTRCDLGETCSGGGCTTYKGYKACCTSPCLYNHDNKDFMCKSGSELIRCSAQYSTMTVNGQACRQDHPCGTYGEEYYWCNTDDDWNYCSPPYVNSVGTDGKSCRDDHECGTYGKSYYWCYTDQADHWTECCISTDPFVAVGGKVCKQESPCGKHGENYLWCHTTDGSWAYCCTAA